ncbi:MAG: biotin/lipoyl-binding protein, partial [Alistipes sp.]|nr:biotin/lipoyl-binding protein [Alistipes sp.]
MYRSLLSFLGLLLCCVACRSRLSPPAIERAVKVERVQAVKYQDRDFAGMSTADDAVNLAFKIAGQVAGVDVSKGDYVKRGQTLARLDPRDVELQVAAD